MTAPRPDPAPDQPGLEAVYRHARLVLVWGFRLSATLLVAGCLLAIARQQPLSDQVNPFGDVVPAVLDGDSAGVIDLAILAMMATPAMAVLAVAVSFVRAGDRRFGALSLVVLGILGISITLALLR